MQVCRCAGAQVAVGTASERAGGDAVGEAGDVECAQRYLFTQSR